MAWARERVMTSWATWWCRRSVMNTSEAQSRTLVGETQLVCLNYVSRATCK
jgi:hypothetical protein